MKYFICIIPPEPVFGELSKIIHDLSVHNQSPMFFPHMTVLGNIDRELDDIQKSVESVARDTKSFYLSFGDVSFGSKFFQSVFVKVNLSAQLTTLNLRIARLLNIENHDFIPHLSLMYGNQDMQTREDISKKTNVRPVGFNVIGLEIVPDIPNPEEWKPIVSVPFK